MLVHPNCTRCLGRGGCSQRREDCGLSRNIFGLTTKRRPHTVFLKAITPFALGRPGPVLLAWRLSSFLCALFSEKQKPLQDRLCEVERRLAKLEDKLGKSKEAKAGAGRLCFASGVFSQACAHRRRSDCATCRQGLTALAAPCERAPTCGISQKADGQRAVFAKLVPRRSKSCVERGTRSRASLKFFCTGMLDVWASSRLIRLTPQ